MQPVYRRILLKISGEVLAGEKGQGFDFDVIGAICAQVKRLTEMGVQVGLVVGGGNFWRGRSGGNMDRTRADHIGMLATVMNSLALADSLGQIGVDARVQTAIEMKQFAELYVRNKAVRHLEKGRVTDEANEKEIMKVYTTLEKYFPSWVGYNMAKCGGCIRACVSVLEKKGGCMENRFKEPLRTGKPWKLDR